MVPRKGLERDVPQLSREPGIAFREQFNALVRITCKHGLLGDGLDRRLILTVRDKEIPRQHYINDLPPSVRTHGAASNGAIDNVVPVARRPRITGNFPTTIAGHDLGERIEPFQRMRLYREYPPIVVRRMGPCIHSRTLCFALFWFGRNRFEGTDRKDERSLGKNVQRNLAKFPYRKST